LAVVSQRLVRLNCPNCSATDSPAPDQFEWFRGRVSGEELNLAKFRKGKGCVRCNGSGYSGRRGVFETVEMTPELAIGIQQSESSAFERAARAQIGTYTMERNAIEMVLTGETTIEEALKVAAGGEM
jgi:MSHA biogenesis protein MshE